MARWVVVRGFGVLAVMVAAGAAPAGCGAREGLSRGPAGRPLAEARSACARIAPGVGPVAYAAPAANGKQERVRQGSQVVLAKRGPSTLAYVADEDDGTVHVVDLDSMLEMATFDVGGTPGQMMMTADSRLLVTLRDRAQMKVFEPTGSPTGAVSERCAVDMPVEPTGLALSPDDTTVFVTSGWGHALTALDASDMHRRFQADLPREPRGVVVSDDGTKVYVAHAVGSAMSVLEVAGNGVAGNGVAGNGVAGAGTERKVRSIALKGQDEAPKVRRVMRHSSRSPKGNRKFAVMDVDMAAAKKSERTSCQGFALAKTVATEGRILAPQVLVESGDATERTAGYGSADGQASEVPDVAVIDQGSDSPLPASLLVRSAPHFPPVAGRECLLPRAAAIDPTRDTLFVACVGSDALVEYDATSAEPHSAALREWRVASGPTGVAIDWADPATSRAVVWSQYERTLNVIPLNRSDEESAKKPVTRVSMSRRPAQPETADIALGRKLFHATGDVRISSDGRACASCHPDGRDDGITWATPDGPRQTPILAGRVDGTAPYAWSGSGEDVKQHLTHTFQRLRGQGLDEHDLDSLVAYITQMAPPPAAIDRTRLERGSRIFHSAEASCATCHGKDGSAPDGLKHDVASRATSDTHGEFDTPSLRFVGGSAPYFHDGRYPSLRALLVGTDGKMGSVSHLAPADLDALEAYVRSL